MSPIGMEDMTMTIITECRFRADGGDWFGDSPAMLVSDHLEAKHTLWINRRSYRRSPSVFAIPQYSILVAKRNHSAPCLVSLAPETFV